MKKKDILLLYSGGMDSTTALYEYQDQIRMAITFNYGSKQNPIEVKVAQQNCQDLGIEHRVIEMDFNHLGFKSDLLTSGGEIPTGVYDTENMKSTVVPFRNGIMLSIAAGLAESNGCQRVMLTNHSGDHAIYPDCTPSFIEAMSEAISSGTYEHIILEAPYTNLSKREIALRGKELGIPYEKSYSCYKGTTIHCGECATCRERKEALKGFDPTTYQN